MSSREAERKRLQRAGYKHRSIPCHDATLKAALLAEELITDAQLDDDAAINEAAGRFLMRHCKVGRLLVDKTAEPKPARKSERTKLRPQERPKHGPCRRWTPEDTDAWESGKTRALALNWRPTYSGGIAGDPGYPLPGDNVCSVLDEFPPDWSDWGRSGDRDGRSRSRIK